MEYGLAFANTMQFAGREGLIELAQSAEKAGFDSLWTVEHVVFPDGYSSSYPYDPTGKMAMRADTPLPDPIIWLTWVAACTERMKLATGILILPQRNPLILAKSLATLDSLSGGRVELGVGVGWLEEEFAALNVPFEGRGARTDEHIRVMRALWDDDHVSFEGDLYRFEGISVNPKPARGRVPIHIGGHTRRAAERAGRLGDGFFPAGATVDELRELLDVMRQTAADEGRDADAIQVTGFAPGVLGKDPVGAVEELAELGVHRIPLPVFLFLQDTPNALAEFGERVVAPTASI
jgi:probable F420-dependent oxidoreductase